MWISKKEYESLYCSMVKAEQLEKENAYLKEKTDLVKLLERFERKDESLDTGKFSITGGSISGSVSIMGVDFDKDVAVYIDDYFGGKVIKQESIKVIAIDKDGNVTYGRTDRKNKKKDFQRDYIIEEV